MKFALWRPRVHEKSAITPVLAEGQTCTHIGGLLDTTQMAHKSRVANKILLDLLRKKLKGECLVSELVSLIGTSQAGPLFPIRT